ncbi:uncharacterized protein RCC_11519 [Ramularia collo-cygni]|uniref:Uncharacterized protein n=1 Tax=Ramularia collo-cygni TaxID=112498 RepID=A0A2D3VI53_9PEZI|nr:uncharacterized protein RCC_11519 [Ramularia collo-cygni]CZT25850.1 uncharacterized protein RCC_11519 [Ramularia collo-cygni]
MNILKPAATPRRQEKSTSQIDNLIPKMSKPWQRYKQNRKLKTNETTLVSDNRPQTIIDEAEADFLKRLKIVLEVVLKAPDELDGQIIGDLIDAYRVWIPNGTQSKWNRVMKAKILKIEKSDTENYKLFHAIRRAGVEFIRKEGAVNNTGGTADAEGAVDEEGLDDEDDAVTA